MQCTRTKERIPNSKLRLHAKVGIYVIARRRESKLVATEKLHCLGKSATHSAECLVLFCVLSSAVFDPRVGRLMDDSPPELSSVECSN